MNDDKQLVVRNLSLLLDFEGSKDAMSRLRMFDRWMTQEGREWHDVRLDLYAQYLLQERQPTTVNAHLSSIRSRYQAILRDNDLRQEWLNHLLSHLSIADAHATMLELERRILNAIDPNSATVKVVKKRDVADEERGIWLRRSQAEWLLNAPGMNDLKGLRDTALFAMMLSLGLRESELTGLDVPDLRKHLHGTLAVHIREGKGAVSRLIPYGSMDWALTLTEMWMAAAGISEGAIFRGLYKGSKRIRPGRLSTRANSIRKILATYPIVVDGQLTTVLPHDLRRTYARALYKSGMKVQEISANMGHADISTTSLYIGSGSAEEREPDLLYSFDMRKVKGFQ
jgi:integrase/recombinase XerD